MSFRRPVTVLSLAALAVLVPLASAAHPETQVAQASAHSASAASSRLIAAWGGEQATSKERSDQAGVVRAVDQRRLGQGSWICSPSGAGGRSDCFER